MRVLNLANYSDAVICRRKEVNNLPSNTVPDMSLSLRQLLDRHNSGGRVKTFEPVYASKDSQIPIDMEKMDKFERWSLSKRISDFIEVERGRIVSVRQAREAAAYKAAVDKAVSERLANSEQAEGKQS